MLSCENLGDVRLQGRLVLVVHLRQHQASIHLGVLGLSNPQLFQVVAPVRRHFLTTPVRHQGSGGAGVRLRQACHLGACLRNLFYDQLFLDLGGCSGLGVSPAAPTGLCARVSERPRLRAVDSERFLKGMGQGTGMAINMGGAACFPVLPAFRCYPLICLGLRMVRVSGCRL